MSATDLFGPIVVGSEVEQATIDTLKAWLPEYIYELEGRLGRTQGLIPPPRSYTTHNTFTTFPDDQIPLCVVISPGIAGVPSKLGDGSYGVDWVIGVGIVASGSDWPVTNFLAKFYAAAVRWVILQQGDLGGVATHMTWLDESYDDVDVEDQSRTIMSAVLMFNVGVMNVVSAYSGPDTPWTPPDPGPPPPDPSGWPGKDWGEVQTIDITLRKEAL